MSSAPSSRARWLGFRDRPGRERGRADLSLHSGSESEVAKQDYDLLAPTPESEDDNQTELFALQAQHMRELARQREEAAARRQSQGQHDKVDEENLALGMQDIPLDNSDEDIEGVSGISSYYTAREQRSPSPFRGLLDLGRRNSMASSTFLEDSCRHRSDFLDPDPDLDVRSNDSDYDILMHSDIWSNADAAVRSRAHRSRFPPPFRHICTETQEDNRSTPLDFDDMEALHVPSNPSTPPQPYEEPWDGWFLSDTPEETYAFERDYPAAAPLLRKIKALPHNKKVELMTDAAVGTWRELASGLDKAVRMGRLVVDGVAWNARDLREIAEERVLDWAPGLFEAMWNLSTGPFLP